MMKIEQEFGIGKLQVEIKNEQEVGLTNKKEFGLVNWTIVG